MAASALPSGLQSALASSMQGTVSDAVGLLAKSKLGLSGLALAVAGFFGIFGVIGLQLQQGILSAYVLFFGVTLILFSLGAQSELIAKYFGFIYQPNGQLGFLLIAGNLAWSTGWLGFLAAAFVNFVAVSAWYYGAGGPGAGDPSAPRASASGMVDVNQDELL